MKQYILSLAVLLPATCSAQEVRTILKGATDQSTYIRIVDSADGTPETGVTSATSGIDLEYVRNRATATDLTESDLAAVDSAHSDGGIKHIGNGVYRVDLPDAAVATGADAVLVTGTVTDMVVIPARIQLSGFDLQDATPATDVTTWNGTAVASPNTAGYPVVTVKDGTGTGEINTASGVVDANVTQILGEAVDASPTLLDVNVTQVLGTSLDDDIAFGGTFEDTIAENISMFFGSVANFGSDSAAATTISDVKVSAAAILDDTGTTGVLISSGTGAGQLNLSGGRADANVLYFGGSVGSFSAGIPAVNVTQIADGTITAAKFGAGAIDAAAIAADAIGASEVAANAIGASELATDAAAEVAGAAWDVTLASHVAAGSTGEALNAAGAAGDPWTTTLPGSYTGSQAGKILSDILADTGTDGVVIASGQTMEMSATELRSALGMAAADLDTQLDAIVADTNELQTDWANGGRLDLILDARASQSSVDTVDGILDNIFTGMELDGTVYRWTTNALEQAPAGGGGGSSVSPDVVTPNRTWVANEYRAINIVEVGDNFTGTLALKPDLNPGTTIATVDSVSITGAATVTATDLTVDRSKTIAHFTVPALATTGTYTVVVTVTTVDGQTIPTTATLKVY